MSGGRVRAAVLGAAGLAGARWALEHVLLAQSRREVASLNDGDPGPMLARYADHLAQSA